MRVFFAAALVTAVSLIACSSFQSSAEPASDGGAVAVADAAAPSDAAGSDAGGDDPASDAGRDASATVVVYSLAFEPPVGWNHPAADLYTVDTGYSGKALGVRGTGGANGNEGLFSTNSGKTIGILGSGQYRVHVRVRHEKPSTFPTLAVALTTGVYVDVTATGPSSLTSSPMRSLTATYTELVQDLVIADAASYAFVAIVATPGSKTADGSFWVDDLLIERVQM